MRSDKYLQLINFLKQQQKLSYVLPKQLQVQIQSKLRTRFINRLPDFEIDEIISHKYNRLEQQSIQEKLSALDDNPITVLGLTFRHNLYNAAGMFKGNNGYHFVNDLKAGAFTFGTTTANPRCGNKKHNITHPFVALNKSQVALNYLGLPNAGDEVLSKHQFIDKHPHCPVIVSLMRSPDYEMNEAMEKLVQSLWLYHNNPTIDMIEINESCPNVNASINDLSERLTFLKKQFLDKRSRHLPVVIKLSNQIDTEQLANITELLITLQFDGVIVGNTVTNYADYLQHIAPCEQALYRYFTEQFGGGLSGVVLKETSLQNIETVASVIAKLQPNHEFALIRCGGISSHEDLIVSEQYGVSLNQWFTGFIESFLHRDVKTYIE